MAQLMAINKKTLRLLDEAEHSPKLALSCIAEIRSQIKLAADIYSQMYSVKVVNEFMAIVSEVLKNVDADVYREFKERVNRERSIRADFAILLMKSSAVAPRPSSASTGATL